MDRTGHDGKQQTSIVTGEMEILRTFAIRFRTAIIAVLCIASIISVTQGYRNAMQNSQDFQWSPTVILVRYGEDPYKEFREKQEGSSRLILSQIPTYSHFTYLLFAPLAVLNFQWAKVVWAALNILFASGAIILLRRRFTYLELLIVYLLFLCSTPLRNSIGNGQQSLLCLFLYVCGVRLADAGLRPAAAIVAGVGSFKFSFGVPLIVAFSFGKLRYALLYLIPTVVGVLFWAVYFHYNLVETIFLPLAVSQTAIGAADLLSVLRSAGFPQVVSLGIPIMVFCAAVVLQQVLVPTDDSLDLTAFYSLVSLVLIYHSSYDQVFLVLGLLHALRSTSGSVQIITFIVVGYFWYGLKAISTIIGWDNWVHSNQIVWLWVNHLCLWTLLIAFVYDLRMRNLTRLATVRERMA